MMNRKAEHTNRTPRRKPTLNKNGITISSDRPMKPKPVKGKVETDD